MHGTAKLCLRWFDEERFEGKQVGSIVSKKKSEEAKKGKRRRLATAKKGKFGAVRIADVKKTAKKHYKKGSKSKTHKGEKDFTTKKSSKVFNRKGHYQKHAKGSRKMRRPYHKKGGQHFHYGDGPSLYAEY